MYTDNMRIKFNLIKPNNKDIEEIINKPITLNGVPIGVITNSELDDSEQYYKCKGVIWDNFIGLEMCKKESFELSSINLTTNKLPNKFV